MHSNTEVQRTPVGLRVKDLVPGDRVKLGGAEGTVQYMTTNVVSGWITLAVSFDPDARIIATRF